MIKFKNGASHTPGPWKRNHLTVRDSRGMVIAEFQEPHRMIRGGEREDDMDWCRNNAQLLTGSPELLAAACAVVKKHGKSNDPVFAALAEAIAKATGSAP